MFYRIIFLIIILFISDGYATSNLSWRYLEKDEFIDVVTPGYGAKDGSIEKAKENIQKFGFQARIPDDLIEPHPLGYSNTKEYRANHLKSVLESEDSKIIWALRGGRGSSFVLPYLKNLTPSQPKLIVGYSDATALHLWAAKREWPSLHGVVLGYNKDAKDAVNKDTSLEDVMDILTGKTREVHYKLTPLNKTAKLQETDICSSVVGGNLSLIQRSIGTDTSLDARDKILFLEDVGEVATKAYEMFNHLDRAGIFEKIKCLFLGNFTSDFQNDDKDNLEKYNLLTEEIKELMDLRNIPVIASDNFGHGLYNHPLPFNTPAVLKFNHQFEEATLSIQTNK